MNFCVIVICSILLAAYVLLMLLYRKGWMQQPSFTVVSDFVPETVISIIIPARNEAQNIGACIDAILAQHYPEDLFEVIVVDDHSTDNTAAIVNGYVRSNIKCIALADYLANGEVVNAFKKKALAAGISVSTGELIVTTDADCTASKEWLRYIAALYQTEKPVMIVAPVDFTNDRSVLQLFQSLDFMSMQGITVASNRLKLGNMCNGANLAFTRAAFNAVNGYEGTEHLASGDDYLLMMKMQDRFPERIDTLKAQQAIVRTAPQTTWNGFLQQRIRWASKSGKYNDKRLTIALVMVYLLNVAMLVLLFFCCNKLWLTVLLPMYFVKTIVEIYYLIPVSRFFMKTRQLVIFPFLQPLHVLYISLAGFLGIVGVYKWKDRKLK
ncbi:glycosyltransferase [Taibaiella soli]|uniref:Glycosyl transferase n=1 Tax=Taibaiella soli TaxID=1649169 RepID=A0A2W2BDF3_9BACT|nr:glycosyltransferase [Taibaiella soli]PZF74279.1 glycosyl transferase [Taibaiella soli]